jgi:hypothetical protein
MRALILTNGEVEVVKREVECSRSELDLAIGELDLATGEDAAVTGHAERNQGRRLRATREDYCAETLGREGLLPASGEKVRRSRG